jgi:hypothetical protein
MVEKKFHRLVRGSYYMEGDINEVAERVAIYASDRNITGYKRKLDLTNPHVTKAINRTRIADDLVTEAYVIEGRFEGERVRLVSQDLGFSPNLIAMVLRYEKEPDKAEIIPFNFQVKDEDLASKKNIK